LGHEGQASGHEASLGLQALGHEGQASGLQGSGREALGQALGLEVQASGRALGLEVQALGHEVQASGLQASGHEASLGLQASSGQGQAWGHWASGASGHWTCEE